MIDYKHNKTIEKKPINVTYDINNAKEKNFNSSSKNTEKVP